MVRLCENRGEAPQGAGEGAQLGVVSVVLSLATPFPEYQTPYPKYPRPKPAVLSKHIPFETQYFRNTPAPIPPVPSLLLDSRTCSMYLFQP
jgi:hypothetical protein